MATLADLQAQLQASARQRFSRNTPLPLVYVALGASDAVGVGASDAANGYVERLAAKLRAHFAPDRTVVLHNLGVSGYTILDIARFQAPRLTALHPDLVTLWTGGNDVVQSIAAEVFRTALCDILAAARRTGAGTFVGTVPDLSVIPMMRALPNWLMPMGDPTRYVRQRSQALGAIVLQAVPMYGGHVVNLPMSRVLSDADLVAADGFHPSDAGHAELADAWWTAIRSFLD